MKTAVFSDIHGNTPALEAILDDIYKHAVDQVIVLGDIINGVDPHGCVSLLRDWQTTQETPLICIQGNAEMYLMTPDLDDLPDHGESWERDVLALIRWFQAQLTQEEQDWIAALPTYLIRDRACFVHDSPIDRLLTETWHKPGLDRKYQEWFYHARGISENLPEATWRRLLQFMEERGFSQVFCGHTHYPFIRRFGSRVICNTGSTGAPLDGDPRPSWVLVEEAPGDDPALTLRRVRYDIDAIHRLVDAAIDYPDFQRPGVREAYKRWRSTGRHYR